MHCLCECIVFCPAGEGSSNKHIVSVGAFHSAWSMRVLIITALFLWMHIVLCGQQFSNNRPIVCVGAYSSVHPRRVLIIVKLFILWLH